MRLLLALVFALCSPFANAAVDGNQLQQLNAALTGYRHDHGDLPQALEALVPHYIAAVPEGCTYDFAAGPAPADLSVVLSPHPAPKDASSRDLRVIEERYFGDAVTVATCVLASGEHTYLTLGGQVYSSRRPWEFTPQSIATALDRMNRDLAADPAQFLRDWSLNGVRKPVAGEQSVERWLVSEVCTMLS